MAFPVKLKIKHFSLLFILIICSQVVYSSSIQVYSINDGLSQSDVSSTVKDQYGFIWIGTQDGLDRFDGYNFKQYRYDKELGTKTITHQVITSLYSHNDGSLWVGTENGLNKYEPASDTFKHYLYPADSLKDPNKPFYISGIEKAPDNMLWVSSGAYGIFQVNPQNGFIKRVPIQGIDKDSQIFFTSVYTDRDNNTWIALIGRGLYKYDSKKDMFVKPNIYTKKGTSIHSFFINAIFQDKYKHLWISTDNGLLNISPDENIAAKIPFANSIMQNNFQKNILGVYQTQSDDLLVINEYGDILLLNRKNMNLENHPLTYSIHNYTHHNRVTTAYQDDTGMIWMGASGSGLIKIDISKNNFNNITYDSGPAMALSDNVVWSIYQERNGVIWVGTDVGGLNRIDLQKHKNTKYIHNPNDPGSLSDNQVWAIYQDKQNTLWFGTGQGGLNRYNPSTNSFTAFKHNENNPKSIISNSANCIFEDSNNNLWIGTENGLDLLDRSTMTFEHFQHDPDNPNSLCYNRVGSIIEPEFGVLWIGTLGGGISEFNVKEKSFKNYTVNSPNSHGLNNGYILRLYQDRNNTIWTGSWGGGLDKYIAEKDSFETITFDFLADGNTIHGIEQDKNGMLWLSTNEGLIKYDPITNYSTQYTYLDGLTSNEFNTGAHFQNSNGEIFFGSIAGLIWFSPDQKIKNTQIPPVVITDFHILGESVVQNKIYNNYTVLDKSIFVEDEIHLSHKEKIISFEFSALNYYTTERNRYAYRLLGVEKEWIDSGNRRFATYTNLKPGHYQFQVRGSNNDGIWNREGASIDVIIHTPFWMTSWFKIFLASSILVIIAGIYVVQNRSMKKRNQYLQSINKNLEDEIHERMRFEQELQDQKNFLETVLNSLQEGITIVDTKECITYLNKGVSKMLGFSSEKLLNTSLLDLFSKDQHQLIKDETEKRKNGVSSQYELQYDHPDGEKRYFRISVSPIFNHDKSYKGSIGAILDITNLKKADDNRKVMEAQLRHAQKMEIIGTLAGGIAHDFNNILVPIIGYTEISIDLLPKDGLVKTNLEKILKASNRAKDLVQQILAFSRQEQRGLEPVEIHSLVNEALKLLRSSLPSTIQIESNIDSKTGTVLADPTQIHQVVMNLCTNAFHAMRESGGTLNVSVTQEDMKDEDRKKFKHIQPGKSYVLLRVSDTGMGMDKVVLSRIFEPFFTTKKVGEGTGLGLSAVHGIVLSHGGDIFVDSVIGKGSRFEIALPQHTILPKKKQSTIPENIPQGSEHILFVDDEEEIVLLYQQILESLGYRITSFTDSIKAFEAFRKNPDQFDLIITDHTMPNMTGIELSKNVLTIKSEQPIIMCTGYSENVTQEKALNIGIKEFIIKPLTMSNIANAIRKTLDKAFSHQESE